MAIFTCGCTTHLTDVLDAAKAAAINARKPKTPRNAPTEVQKRREAGNGTVCCLYHFLVLLLLMTSHIVSDRFADHQPCKACCQEEEKSGPATEGGGFS